MGDTRDMSTYQYSRLRGRIREKYRTERAFAQALNLTTTSLSCKLNGKSGFSQGDIITWANLLEIETADIGSYFFA